MSASISLPISSSENRSLPVGQTKGQMAARGAGRGEHRQQCVITFMVLDGTKVRSAMRMLKRMTRHMGPTRPFQVYLGMYSGMCVWYDTCSMQSFSMSHQPLSSVYLCGARSATRALGIYPGQWQGLPQGNELEC